MRATLIHNPTAGDSRPTAADLEKILTEAGFQVRYQSSKKDWKKALQRASDLVIAAGGDGTVAKVMRELSGTGRTVAVLPVGTANNIARTLGIAGDAREIVASWKRATGEPFDVGAATSANGHYLFVESFGGGLFARLIMAGKTVIESSASMVGNETDRALIVLRGLIEDSKPQHWRVEVDGKDFSGDYICVEAMNIRHAGPSIPLAPGARTSDGLLDLVMVRARDRQPLVRYVNERLEQHRVNPPELLVERGREIVLQGTRAAMRVDDRALETRGGEWAVTVMPGAARLLETAAARS